MATKSVSDLDGFSVMLEVDSTGGKSGTVTLRLTNGNSEGYSVDLAAAVVTAAGVTGLSQANVTAAVKQFVLALRAQGRTTGGWS